MGRKNYEEGLNDLEMSIQRLADIAIERVEWGVEALETGDEELARKVITSDDEVDDLYIEVEKKCTDLLALHQPVAKDLRYITAVFKISTDLERIADLAVNLGEYTIQRGETEVADVDLPGIGEYAIDMVNSAAQSFYDEDMDLAATVVQRDDEMDRRCEEMNNVLIDHLMKSEFEPSDRSEDVISAITTILLAIRDLERVADHSVNIAARTVYMASNDRRYI